MAAQPTHGFLIFRSAFLIWRQRATTSARYQGGGRNRARATPARWYSRQWPAGAAHGLALPGSARGPGAKGRHMGQGATISGPGEGRKVHVFGVVLTLRASGAAGGDFAVWEEAAPPGFGPPRHIHLRMDEAFQILEGQYEVWATAASTSSAGRDGDDPQGHAAHFRCMGPAPGRMLTTVVPGGLDDFFIEIESRGFKLPDDLAAGRARQALWPRVHRAAARRLIRAQVPGTKRCRSRVSAKPATASQATGRLPARRSAPRRAARSRRSGSRPRAARRPAGGGAGTTARRRPRG